MAKDDYGVVCYKVLSYLYRCLKEGIEPNITQAEEFTGINHVYFKAVIADLFDCGYVRCNLKTYPPRTYEGLSITFLGVEYLEESSYMSKVKKFLGKAFEISLKAAIEAAKAM